LFDFEKIILLFSNCSEVTVKTFILLHKIKLSIHQRILKNVSQFPQKQKQNSTTVFNIINNHKSFLSIRSSYKSDFRRVM